MLRLYNTLTRRVELFIPREQGVVRMYTCGPTVYRYVHLGNLRSFLMADWARRALEWSGYTVTHIKNITDVGHMRQELVDRGEDKLIAAALAEGKTPAEIAAFYTESFLQDERRLNILPAQHYPRATDHVQQMIALIGVLEQRGYAYRSGQNVYFDVRRFSDYGRLSGNRLEDLLEGVRAEADSAKRNPEDFALWKGAEPGRAMKWESPWGPGFPGWHIECSAMAMHYLGQQIDLHTGGVDNIFPHHEDEIAQSEAATGVPFARCWLHGAFLLADGLKMAKSQGNVYLLQDVIERGFDPLSFRLLCAMTHYRTPLNFTLGALRGAQHALDRLRRKLLEAEDAGGDADQELAEPWRQRFSAALADDLGLPQAVATVWAMLEAGLPPATICELLVDWDRVLGLRLAEWCAEARTIPLEVQALAAERSRLRQARDYAAADVIRDELIARGYEVLDHGSQTELRRRGNTLPSNRPLISSPRDVPSLLDQPSRVRWSVLLFGQDNADEMVRAVSALLLRPPAGGVEILAVDAGSGEAAVESLATLAALYPEVRAFYLDHNPGEGAGRNVGLRQALGEYILWLGNHIEPLGDIWGPLEAALSNPAVGAAGGWGLRTADLHHFEPGDGPEVDALEAYVLAFRRSVIREVGLLDEGFRFYRNLDLDFSMRLRARGYTLVVVPGLPVRVHEHRLWQRTPEPERERLSRHNFRRFLRRWRDRHDLLISSSGVHEHHHGRHDHDHHHHEEG